MGYLKNAHWAFFKYPIGIARIDIIGARRRAEMNPSKVTRYQSNPDVACRVEGEGEKGVLFNPDRDAVLVINAISLLLWNRLAKPYSADDLVTFLLSVCEDVPENQVMGDVETFLKELLSGGFIGVVLEE
jgi:hypothetical protein